MNKIKDLVINSKKLFTNYKILKLILALLIPLFFSRIYYTRINEDLINFVLKMYNSEDIQLNNYSISTKSFSRKDAALLKIKLISKLPKKDLILLANHQLQFFSQELNDKSIFNMWMADYGITQIADIIAYADKYNNGFFPRKILATAITTPNNDNGNVIVGYGDEMPERMIGFAKNPYTLKVSQIIFSPGKLLTQSQILRLLRHTFDYKNLWGVIKTNIFREDITKDINIVREKSLAGNFSFNLTGSSTGYKNSPDGNGLPKKLIFNENQLNSKVYISKRDINEIVYSLNSISKIANKRDLIHVVIIPPVYEADDPLRMNSEVNKVFDEAIDQFAKLSTDSLIIDHRRDKRFLGKDKEKYYYHFDHPSAAYGQILWEEINKAVLEKY